MYSSGSYLRKIELIQGVVLYIVSFSDPINNWRIRVDNFEVSWLSKYIYSVYFACTSALTVGYGDITPRNLLEIVTILFVEVFGTFVLI